MNGVGSMIIKGLVGDKLASMSFNEHHYVLKKVAMSFSTLYYLGLDPIFANYIKENDTLVVSGKISERDLLEEEATIYSGIIITKDKESISAADINNNTKYLKNIDVKTGECFSRYYFDGDIKDIKLDLYSYKENNSFVLVTPNLEKNDFNIFLKFDNYEEKIVNDSFEYATTGISAFLSAEVNLVYFIYRWVSASVSVSGAGSSVGSLVDGCSAATRPLSSSVAEVRSSPRIL